MSVVRSEGVQLGVQGPQTSFGWGTQSLCLSDTIPGGKDRQYFFFAGLLHWSPQLVVAYTDTFALCGLLRRMSSRSSRDRSSGLKVGLGFQSHIMGLGVKGVG